MEILIVSCGLRNVKLAEAGEGRSRVVRSLVVVRCMVFALANRKECGLKSLIWTPEYGERVKDGDRLDHKCRVRLGLSLVRGRVAIN